MSAHRAPELMRQQNRTVILETIQERGPISRVELARLLKLNPATVTRITRVLLEEGLIQESGEGINTGTGRKPVLLSFNLRARLLIGLHLTPHDMTGIVTDMAGNILARQTLLAPTVSAHTTQTLIHELLSADPSYQRCLAAVCLNTTHNSEALAATVSALQESIGVPVCVEETAILAALGEAEWGAAHGQSHFALLYLDEISRSCAYLDGTLHAGGMGTDAALQPLSARLNSRHIVARAQTLLDEFPESAFGQLTASVRLSVGVVFEAARQHDPLALALLDEVIADLAQAVAHVSDVLALDFLVLGGTWQQAADVLIPAVQKHLTGRGGPAPTLIGSGLGTDAPLLGAIKRALELVDIVA